MMNENYLKEICAGQGISLQPDQLEQLDRYSELLVEWNQKMNLTAITDPKEMAEKHFLDSLLLTKAVEISQGGSLIDVGTGAGFPSLPVKILRPDISLTMLDSLQKRLTFLEAVCGELKVRANLLHARAEEAGRKPEYREQYDLATARAVAKLPVLCEYCLPFVKVGGVFAALKGSDAENEAKEAQQAIRLLGGTLREIKSFTLPDGSRRGIIVIEKTAPTPAKYPRQGGKIAKSPLG